MPQESAVLTALPSWMAPAPPIPSPVSTTQLRLQNELTLIENSFERALEHVRQGKPLAQFVEEYPIEIEYTRLLAWIMRDEDRKLRYREAQEIGAEVVADQMIQIADGTDTGLPEDIDRATLRINTRKWLLGVWNRKRFGETRQIEQNVNVNLGDAMAAAQARVEQARVVDVTAREIR
ncbi:hypothetical protein UFOVP669_50 [uncultured Caudovirales phage]|uniref:Terminase small subunit n=1 Tax=uncultured Caudovirales phage TaxID=2100421 RepID=A0A6J5M1I0_9CAUD|nr:hypothetical protein UFOVP400_41 [uncultured Caudovirales phage]CAB4156222.1 hypothetical protein UFOVP669_50 [uncultured Caudovirales phage]CAB4213440.1 hypothetical protein UFOVP1449_22 [uncultured Caudovirales phage]